MPRIVPAKAFDDAAELIDPAIRTQLAQYIGGFFAFVRSASAECVIVIARSRCP